MAPCLRWVESTDRDSDKLKYSAHFYLISVRKNFMFSEIWVKCICKSILVADVVTVSAWGIAWCLDGTLMTVLWPDTPECWAPVISTRVKPPPPAPGLTRASGNYVNTGLITPLHCITCPLLGHCDRVTGSDQTTSHHNDLTKTSTCLKLGSIRQLPIYCDGRC